MPKTACLTAAIALALSAAAFGQPKSDPKIDRITLKKGGVAEGTVTKDSYTKVEIQISGGSPTGYTPAEIARSGPVVKIDFWDMPGPFRGALNDIEAGNWQEALGKIAGAEDSVNLKEIKVIPRAFWFGAWVNYYRGVCLKELARPEDAIKSFKKLIDKQKDSRFVPDAYELILECYRDKGDSEGADAFLQEIEKAPKEIQPQLKKRAQKQKAEILLTQDKPKDALPLFEGLTNDADPDIKADAIMGVIKCKSKIDPEQLASYCKTVLTTAQDASLLLAASNALGDSAFGRKQYAEAKNYYIDSVVRYHPGRSSPLAKEHEKALYHLARCYEEMAAGAKDANAKKTYEIMAGRTYRELSLEYASGRYRDEAAAKAAKLDKAD
jgi:tetratricopeptide (TPR) repeat protein